MRRSSPREVLRSAALGVSRPCAVACRLPVGHQRLPAGAVTQTVRYLASSLGLAVLGTVLIDENRSNIIRSFTRQGIPRSVASHVAAALNSGASSAPRQGASARRLLGAVQYDFAQSTRTVYIAMAAVMAASFVLAFTRLERGVPEEVSLARLDRQPPGDEPQAASAPIA